MDIKDKLKGHHFGVKTFDLKLEDIDMASRQVKGYFASFNTLDSDLDVMLPGAFLKSIGDRGPKSTGNRKIAHLRDHNFTHQIGRIDELGEDEKGLFFISTLGTSSKGEDALRDYDEGILREHSFGFEYIEDKMTFQKESNLHEDGHWDIKEVVLWEGSGVTFGSNSLTPVIGVTKGMTTDDQLKRLNEMTDALELAIKNGKGTDARLENIELQFKQLKQLQNSLATIEPIVKGTQTEPPVTTTQKGVEMGEPAKQFFINLTK